MQRKWKKDYTVNVSHKVSVSNESAIINEMKCCQEPVCIGGVDTDKKKAYDTPSPTQWPHDEIGKTQYPPTVEGWYQHQPHLFPRICKQNKTQSHVGTGYSFRKLKRPKKKLINSLDIITAINSMSSCEPRIILLGTLFLTLFHVQSAPSFYIHGHFLILKRKEDLAR